MASSLLQSIVSSHERLDLAAFGRRFDELSREAKRRFVKVEYRQQFHEPDVPSYNKYMAGDREAALKLMPEERFVDKDCSVDFCRRSILDVRLRFIARPLTPYLLWEFESYRLSARWGERICIVDITDDGIRRQFADATDFLLFDDDHVLMNWYDDAGVFRGGWDVHDQDVIVRCNRLADSMTSVCVPLALFEWEHKL
jgi:hypothetical protein